MRCSSLFVARVVFSVLACTSIVVAAPIPVRRDDVHQSWHPSESKRANTLITLVSREFTGYLKRALLPLSLEERAASDGTLANLFPISGALSKWTTLADAPEALELSDATFRPTRVSGQPYSYVSFQGKTALKAHYPKGSYKPSATNAPKGGLSFYAPGPASVDLSTAEEATFGYSIFFPKGFEFVKGGKLPGVCAYFACSMVCVSDQLNDDH
jgi:hypothetical protein